MRTQTTSKVHGPPTCEYGLLKVMRRARCQRLTLSLYEPVQLHQIQGRSQVNVSLSRCLGMPAAAVALTNHPQHVIRKPGLFEFEAITWRQQPQALNAGVCVMRACNDSGPAPRPGLRLLHMSHKFWVGLATGGVLLACLTLLVDRYLLDILDQDDLRLHSVTRAGLARTVCVSHSQTQQPQGVFCVMHCVMD